MEYTCPNCGEEGLRTLNDDLTYCMVCGYEIVSERLEKEREFLASIEERGKEG